MILDHSGPDLALIATMYCAMKLPANRGWWAGCVLGFVQDCLSGGILGVNTFSKSLMAYIIFLLRRKILVEGVVPVCVFLLIASLFDGLVLTWCCSLPSFLFSVFPFFEIRIPIFGLNKLIDKLIGHISINNFN